MKHLLFLLFAVVLISCYEQKAEIKKAPIRPKSGHWEISFNTGEVQIPARLSVDSSGQWSFVNDNEIVTIDSLTWNGDTFHVKLPLFQSFLKGYMNSDSSLVGEFLDPTRSADYKIPFTGSWAYLEGIQSNGWKKEEYEVTFSPMDEEAKYKAIGVFSENGDRITGTFMTESGDYRFLEGTVNGDSIHLSCFDGAHLFYFTAISKNDSLVNGMFYSGNHWKEPWVGVKNDAAQLRDPESLTMIKETDVPFQFAVLNESGDSVVFDSKTFDSKVTIIQLFGSWCPNCIDESRFFNQLYSEFHSKGLEVVTVAFERSDNFEESKRAVLSQWNDLNLSYRPFFGKNRSRAIETFYMLNHVMSFPTSIVVDKKSEVRKIYTGFYGPSTGEHYAQYCDRTRLFIEQLLAE